MAMTPASTACPLQNRASSSQRPLVDRLNQEWHKPALQAFMVIVLAHWAEHLAQAVQIYALHWPIPKSLGVLTTSVTVRLWTIGPLVPVIVSE